jgi:hypothetical protein
MGAKDGPDEGRLSEGCEMSKTMEATLVKPAQRALRRPTARTERRGTLSLVERALRLFMWTVVALFTLLLAVVIVLG